MPLPDENQINKKSLKDFAAYANDLKNQGKLDLNKPFEIVIEAELDEQGKLKNPRCTKQDGDENLGGSVWPIGCRTERQRISHLPSANQQRQSERDGKDHGQAGREGSTGVGGVGSFVTATRGIARERAQQSALFRRRLESRKR